MKRSNTSVRTNRLVKKQESAGKKSRYAQKFASGNQMYGPGCCAHSHIVRNRRPVVEGEQA